MCQGQANMHLPRLRMQMCEHAWNTPNAPATHAPHMAFETSATQARSELAAAGPHPSNGRLARSALVHPRGNNRTDSRSFTTGFWPYVGHFDHNGPEGPSWRVFVHNNRLWVKGSLREGSKPMPLEPVGPDTFRLGEKDYSPECIQFDTFMNGHALRMTRSGVLLYRKDTP
jgi:hypothetical protein